jgi:hypothetical protein
VWGLALAVRAAGGDGGLGRADGVLGAAVCMLEPGQLDAGTPEMWRDGRVRALRGRLLDACSIWRPSWVRTRASFRNCARTATALRLCRLCMQETEDRRSKVKALGGELDVLLRVISPMTY